MPISSFSNKFRICIIKVLQQFITNLLTYITQRKLIKSNLQSKVEYCLVLVIDNCFSRLC